MNNKTPNAKDGIVDVHAHVVMPSYNELLVGFGYKLPGYSPPRFAKPLAPAASPRPMPPAISDADDAIDKRIALMDEAGVSRQLLSTAFAPYLETESQGLAAAQHVNDVHARIMKKHPDRFSAFVALPLPHVEASLVELRRGMDELGMVGAGMHCFCLDQSTADDQFLPIYEELNRREAVLFFHPTINGMCTPFVTEWGLTSTVGTVFEDSALALHLIAKQIPHRFPKIKIIVPHFGGVLPMLLERLDNQLPQSMPDLPEKPSVTARRFWYDTVGHGSKAACTCAVEAFGASQVLPGSDYPFLLPFESYDRTFAYIREIGLDESTVNKILHQNARDLFDGA